MWHEKVYVDHFVFQQVGGHRVQRATREFNMIIVEVSVEFGR